MRTWGRFLVWFSECVAVLIKPGRLAMAQTRNRPRFSARAVSGTVLFSPTPLRGAAE